MFDQVLQSLKGERNSFKNISQEYYQPLCHLQKTMISFLTVWNTLKNGTM